MHYYYPTNDLHTHTRSADVQLLPARQLTTNRYSPPNRYEPPINRSQNWTPHFLETVQKSDDFQWFARINQALDNNDFELYEQPIVSVQAGQSNPQISEILLRLKKNNGQKIVGPMAFLPVAEKYNLMPKIDKWVITTALRHLAKQQRPLNKLYTINLSGSSINDNHFLSFLKQQLQQHPVEAKSVCFEITERVAIANLSKAAHFILELKKLGCTFALDDFGSGVSSFIYLKTLPIDYLKIDGGLVREAATDAISATMVEAINRIGQTMGLKTIAEYVENAAILDKVAALGIDYVQGYAIGKPHPLESG